MRVRRRRLAAVVCSPCYNFQLPPRGASGVAWGPSILPHFHVSTSRFPGAPVFGRPSLNEHEEKRERIRSYLCVCGVCVVWVCALWYWVNWKFLSRPSCKVSCFCVSCVTEKGSSRAGQKSSFFLSLSLTGHVCVCVCMCASPSKKPVSLCQRQRSIWFPLECRCDALMLYNTGIKWNDHLFLSAIVNLVGA